MFIFQRSTYHVDEVLYMNSSLFVFIFFIFFYLLNSLIGCICASTYIRFGWSICLNSLRVLFVLKRLLLICLQFSLYFLDSLVVLQLIFLLICWEWSFLWYRLYIPNTLFVIKSFIKSKSKCNKFKITMMIERIFIRSMYKIVIINDIFSVAGKLRCFGTTVLIVSTWVRRFFA